MTNSVRKSVVLGAMLVVMLVPMGAQAACTIGGYIVERVLAYGTGNGYVYFRPRRSLTNTAYYYCRINDGWNGDNRIASLAAVAQANRTEVNAQGNRSSCETDSNRYMGYCTYIYMLN
jgi:hypothetical protein